MTSVTVRLSEKEKKGLLKIGKPVSESIREGIDLYLKSKKRRELLKKLEELQRVNPPLLTSTEEEVQLIREDRRHR